MANPSDAAALEIRQSFLQSERSRLRVRRSRRACDRSRRRGHRGLRRRSVWADARMQLQSGELPRTDLGRRAREKVQLARLDALLHIHKAGGNRRVVLRLNVPHRRPDCGSAWHLWCRCCRLADRVDPVPHRDCALGHPLGDRESTTVGRLSRSTPRSWRDFVRSISPHTAPRPRRAATRRGRGCLRLPTHLD